MVSLIRVGEVFAKVDDKDVAAVSAFTWQAHTCRPGSPVYAKSTPGHGAKNTWMHRLIMDAPEASVVDHINGDGLDNRRCNLRVCTPQQNLWNRGRQSNNTSGFTGVYLRPSSGRWVAKLRVSTGFKYCGFYATAEEAARAWDREALKQRGEFARLNFPAENAA